MLIYFFTKQPELCKKISENLEKEGFKSIIFDSLQPFYQLMNTNDTLPNLFVFDYSEFQHDIFNVYRYMQEMNRSTPLIFYNDPYPDSKARVEFWIYQCKIHLENSDSLLLELPFRIIAKTVDSPEMAPYIPLIQKPQLLPAGDITVSPQKKQFESPQEFNIYEFSENCNMQPSVFLLFEYLYKHHDCFVSIDELQRYMFKKGKTGKKGSVYSYISRLREYLGNKTNGGIGILQSNKHYKLIFY